jgi:predicted Rossmann fold flavoprotein
MLNLLDQHRVTYEERTLGQLFCQKSARAIVNLLVNECTKAGAHIQTDCTIQQVSKEGRFLVRTTQGNYRAEALVIATGGLSYANIGASGFGYDIARQFDINVLPCSPGLVPFTLGKNTLKQIRPLSGIAVSAIVSYKERSFQEALLFTHTGLSGPVILQISNYWQPGDRLEVNLLPDHDLATQISRWQQERPKAYVKNLLAMLLPKRLIQQLLPSSYTKMPVKQCSVRDIVRLADCFQHWRLRPSGTEGFRKAEVTRGGIDTNELSSKTFEARRVKGLFFIGEVLDVTGWLGGYNLQWAWSSGYCAGQYV